MESGNRKDLDWQEYEAITKYIYEILGVQYGIKVIGYGGDNKVQGKSGVKHQVDVLTGQDQGGRTHLTAIECKFLKKKVTKETVMKLRSESPIGDKPSRALNQAWQKVEIREAIFCLLASGSGYGPSHNH